MQQAPLATALPAGIPASGSGHGRLVWSADEAVSRSYGDWVVFWVCAGEAAWELKDGRRLSAAKNGFVVLPPLVATTMSAVRPKLVWWHCHFTFRPAPGHVPDHLREDVLGPGEAALLPLAFTGDDAPGVLRAFRELSLLAFPAAEAPWRIERAVIVLVAELAAFARARTRARAPARVLGPAFQEDQRIAAVMRRIDADPAQPWRVPQLARSVGISPHRLHALCRSTYGASVKSRIVSARLELAKRLLRERENGRLLTLKEVSERSGFSSQHFFSRQFRSFYHISPSAFRTGEALGERLKDVAEWGDPVLSLPGEGDAWERDWVVLRGGFVRGDRRVVVSAHEGSTLMCRRRLWGDIAIEFEGLVPSDVASSDLSIFWIRGDQSTTLDWRTEQATGTYRFQVGARGSYTIIGHENTHLAYDAFKPVPGTAHLIRVEIQDRRLSLFVDGRKSCEHIDAFPLIGGHVAIYGFFLGVEFRDVRIYSRQPPAMVPATAVGDHCLEQRRYDEAAEQYAKVADAHAGTRLALDAVYKRGLSRFRQGRAGDAFAIWEGLRGTPLADTVELHRLDEWFTAGEHERMLAHIPTVYRDARPDTKARLALQWAGYTSAVTAEAMLHGRTGTLAEYVATRDRFLSAHPTTAHAAAQALIVLGRFEEVLERFPTQLSCVTQALTYLGREGEILEHHGDQMMAVAETLFSTGRTEELVRRYPGLWAESESLALISRGRAAEVLEIVPTHSTALLALGRMEEALGDPLLRGDQLARVLLLLDRPDEIPAELAHSLPVLMARGRSQEAFDRHGGNFWIGMWPRHLLGLEAFMLGRTAQALRWFELPPGWELHQRRFHLAHYVLVPFLRELSGDTGALARVCDVVLRGRRWVYEQKAWHNAAFLLGRIDAATYLAQPHCFAADASLSLCRGIRAELDGDVALARASYRSYLGLPRYRRGLDYDPVPERFAAWRVETIG
ncbi:MAG: helix-turn-helix domain-containing protein [Planctomycetes bacterium]|nr:helix-turn-helix domain-containing protein [Planctomycetota bacterium]